MLSANPGQAIDATAEIGRVYPPRGCASAAKLYGVVRFFYPGDTAASLDWNRVAVHGVKRVRTAVDAATLSTGLKEIFWPMGPGIGIGAKLPPSRSSDDGLPRFTSQQTGPGLWYVDLTQAQWTQVSPMLSRLAGARGVAFDIRGYPTDAGARVLQYLLSEPERDRWMHISQIVGPFGQSAGWQDFGWDLRPASPRIAGKIVFLTDGRAISYAESVMGYVADRKLGTIVGTPTAGTNGNVATFAVPSGFNVSFAGMRVTGHDGHASHDLVGVKPDIAVEMSIAGPRSGDDDVLERAVDLINSNKPLNPHH